LDVRGVQITTTVDAKLLSGAKPEASVRCVRDEGRKGEATATGT